MLQDTQLNTAKANKQAGSDSWTSAYRQVTLVANQHNCHVGVGMLPSVFKPACKVIEGFSPASLKIDLTCHAW